MFQVWKGCDDCLGGFHLKCLKPPLKEVPEGDWICQFCEARKLGKEVVLPNPPKGKKRKRTAREKLLPSDLWAAHIEKKSPCWNGRGRSSHTGNVPGTSYSSDEE
ncbi:hypothetical protein VitviT2T_019909 [Vitis vinifera]|uniref:PHD-type domain-containing protein n=1 Tax=Vitis vinifera TaxID=29760 RepID=A0ABY9D278_VITVI|nr:hypothetical protein VitviT2T_019909 [Vitis vinifera]